MTDDENLIRDLNRIMNDREVPRQHRTKLTDIIRQVRELQDRLYAFEDAEEIKLEPAEVRPIRSCWDCNNLGFTRRMMDHSILLKCRHDLLEDGLAVQEGIIPDGILDGMLNLKKEVDNLTGDQATGCDCFFVVTGPRKVTL